MGKVTKNAKKEANIMERSYMVRPVTSSIGLRTKSFANQLTSSWQATLEDVWTGLNRTIFKFPTEPRIKFFSRAAVSEDKGVTSRQWEFSYLQTATAPGRGGAGRPHRVGAIPDNSRHVE